MSFTEYDLITGQWRKRTKTEVMNDVDCEGNRPCEQCWEDARDKGIYAWPLKVNADRFNRCVCGRMIGLKTPDKLVPTKVK